jgi:hypothetical protein
MKQKTILLSLILFIFLNISLFSAPSFASITSSSYKKYKAEYGSQKDKGYYFKIKTLKKEHPKLYWAYKHICDKHKHDSKKQLSRLSSSLQKICKQYDSYRGRQNYIYYRNKHEDNNDNDDAINTYTLTYTAGDNGSITGVSPQTVNYGASGSAVTAVPDEGYHFLKWSDESTDNPRTDTNVTGNVLVAASFSIDSYVITASSGDHGSVAPDGATTKEYNTSQTYTITPDTGYYIEDVLVDSVSVGAVATYDFTNIQANHIISATFAINTYTLTYTAGDNGSITGVSLQTVNYGASGSAVTAVPDEGYHFLKWSDESTDNPRTDTNVTGNKSVTAEFVVWLSGWSNRKSVTLSRESGAVTNYQMKLLLGESPEASGEDVDCGGLCQTDFDDIRFTTSDGSTLLDYWIESASGATPNQLATVWIEFNSIGTEATTFYMYYGNAAAAAVSNGTNTFKFFDDFATLDGDVKWYALGSVTATTDGSLTVAQLYSSGSPSLMNTRTSWGAGNASRVKLKTDHFNSASYTEILALRHNPSWRGQLNYYCHTYPGAAGNLSLYSGTNEYRTEIGANWSAGVYKIVDNIYYASNNNKVYYDGTLIVHDVEHDISADQREIFYYVEGSGAKIRADWALIRQCLPVEPAWGSWGVAETN